MSQNSRVAQALAPFKNLFDAFQNAGFQLYAVGGCVRDWSLNVPPKDIDFTTDALPEQTKQILQTMGLKVIPVGEVFGTIATILHKKQYEITTFRVQESYTRGSRHPIVCYGHELQKDLERRDLTINAMAADGEGHIIDPFDGLGDLEKRRLRVPKSSYAQALSIFGDDPLRMLRLARFMARLDFQADDCATQAACAMAGAIHSVSHERWFSEIDGLLRAPHPALGLNWLTQTGIAPLLLPEFEALKHARRITPSLSDAPFRDAPTETCPSLWAQTLDLIPNAPKDSDLRWCALFALLGAPCAARTAWAQATAQMLARQIMTRLKCAAQRIEHNVRTLELLPQGEPSKRAVREHAILLGSALNDWNAFQDVRLMLLPQDVRETERARLQRWRDALQPYLQNPDAAEVQLPKDLSKALSDALNVRGKTLGLCIAQCREAVLDDLLSENDPTQDFVQWVRAHF